MNEFIVDPYAVLLQYKYLSNQQTNHHHQPQQQIDLSYDEEYCLTQPVFGIILIVSEWPCTNQPYITQLEQLQHNTNQLLCNKIMDNTSKHMNPILWTANHALHITMSTVMRFTDNIIDSTYYNNNSTAAQLVRLYDHIVPDHNLIKLRKQCLCDWIDVIQQISDEVDITQSVTLTVQSIQLTDNACIALINDKTNTIHRIRELLLKYTKQHEHSEQLLDMIKIPNIIHSTLFRFIDTIPDPILFRQQFDELVTQWIPVDITMSGYELIVETVPYMHHLPHSQVTVLKHNFGR